MSLDAIRFRRLGYVALNVCDIERSTRFYAETVGLALTERRGETAFLRCSDRHHEVMLAASDKPGLKRIGWQMESEKALDALVGRLRESGFEVTPVGRADAEALSIGRAFRCDEPVTGATFEFYVDMAPAPAPWKPGHTNIARLGHIVVGSPDRDATDRFLVDHLNFRVSDQIEEMITFMRCFPNPLHHSFGVGATPAPILHHVNFMVSEIDDIGKAINRTKQAGSEIVYGPGRHPPSESVFLYFLDPDGITLEYSFGMEEFGERDARAPRLMPKGLESLDYWGGAPAPNFGRVGAIE